ncbi:MAG: response regulator [Chloroflexi bacterium]|nr:MAG: response regulator [Chloroflexota bacterium]TMF28252.1 MAG: response regulator [Chloroflexota bacterium]
MGGPRRRGRAILLVEDNADDEALTLRAFRKNNLTNEIIVKRDGAEALAWLFDEEREVDPQVVLLDLKLPKVDGLEVLRRIRADSRTSLLPVVILTSSSVESDLVRGYELRANSYIRKPVDFQRFIDAAREIGLYWLVMNETPGVRPPTK